MKTIFAFALCFLFIHLYACNRDSDVEQTNNSNNTLNTDTTKMKITIGTNIFTTTLYNNATAKAFKAMLPLTIDMTELNANEKYFDLPNALPNNPSKPATIQTGDLMLYGSNTLVLFYKTFSTPYRYTQIGRIENPSGLATALSSGSVTVTFSAE